ICDDNMERVRKDVDTTWKGRTVTFRGLEVWVCSGCGEEAYEPDDVRMMQEFIQETLPSKDYPRIMNVEETARLLRVSNQTVYNLAQNGKLPGAKFGREWRFLSDELLDYMKRPRLGGRGKEDK
ncbi:MAG TPA: helix-turn-helix domain-containing protein, partial [Spirochaetia bacterium]|nr:helix-turn-helix domain-containing protein [Spirochaetia bacterium]